MGLFDRKKEGGLMDVIRCDESEYLVWKWRPSGEANSTKKENSIRYGSSLRVKDGEVAVFVYPQEGGKMQDFIEGPYDKKIETANFPVLTSIVGAAFGGNSPFQAEIYFINLAGIIQVKFAVPYFDVFDPRFNGDFGVPVAVRGAISFNITDYKSFIKQHRLIDFDLESFKMQVRDTVVKRVRGIVSNVPKDCQIPVVQLGTKIMQVSDVVQTYLVADLSNVFGVNVRSVDISSIEIDKESDGWRELRKVTAEQQTKITEAQTDISIRNEDDRQRINAMNMEETLRIQREEAQRAQRLQTESNYLGAHALNLQAGVLNTAAEGLGQMSMNLGGGADGSGFNPAGMMMGMALGGSMGGQMTNMMNQMGQQINNSMNTPPPLPQSQYMVADNGQQYGPFVIQQLVQLVQSGKMTQQTYVWKQGMVAWELAGNVAELAMLFTPVAPPPAPDGMPTPPVPPAM